FGSTQILVSHGDIVRGAAWCRRPRTHAACGPLPLVPARHDVASCIRGRRVYGLPKFTNEAQHLFSEAWPWGGSAYDPSLGRPKVQRTLVVFPVRPGLGHGQGALALLLVEAPPLRRRPARCERAGDPGVVLDRVARGARGDLFARHSVRVARAMAVAPTHQIDVDMVVVIDVRAGRQHRAELIAGRGLHVAQKTLLLRQAAPAVLHRDLASVGKGERRDVERVAEGVLGNARPG